MTTAPAGAPSSAPAEEIDVLIGDLEHDLARLRARDRRVATSAATMRAAEVRVTKSTLLASLVMPVVNLDPWDIRDSWGAPRDGGRRKHRGIDLFAPRGTPIVAVTPGVVSYIGVQPKGGRCLWLTTDQGLSFYYAHLDRWAPGLYEGMAVRQGDVLGYVGNTGNAISTPPHLHFSVVDGDESLNPYPILSRSKQAKGRPILSGGFAAGGGAQ